MFLLKNAISRGKADETSKRHLGMNPKTMVGKKITIAAPAPVAWKMLTEPSLVKSWMKQSEMEIVTDWTVDNPIVFRGDLRGMKNVNKGTILKYDREKVLEYSSWSTMTRLPDEPKSHSVIAFEPVPDGDKTELRLTQSNITAKAGIEHSDYYWDAALAVVKRIAERS